MVLNKTTVCALKSCMASFSQYIWLGHLSFIMSTQVFMHKTIISKKRSLKKRRILNIIYTTIPPPFFKSFFLFFLTFQPILHLVTFFYLESLLQSYSINKKWSSCGQELICRYNSVLTMTNFKIGGLLQNH